MVYLRDVLVARDDGSTSLLFAKLREFNSSTFSIFWADLFKMLSILSKDFQSKLVDIFTIGAIVKTEIVSIRMCFLVDSCDLNQN
jgi:hypothetical protein